MVAHQSQLHLMDKELFQEVHKGKLEFGESLNKPKLCKPRLNSTEGKFGQSKLTRIIHKL